MCFYSPYQSPHVRNSKNLLDSEFRYWIPDSLAVKLGFQIPILSRIPDCLSCNSNSKDLEKFAGFRIARRDKISRIPESKCLYGAITNHLAYFKLVKPTLYTPYCKFVVIQNSKKKNKNKNKNKKGKLELISHANNHA